MQILTKLKLKLIRLNHIKRCDALVAYLILAQQFGIWNQFLRRSDQISYQINFAVCDEEIQ